MWRWLRRSRVMCGSAAIARWIIVFYPHMLSLALLLTLQLQSPDGRRMVHAEESRAPIVVDGALDEEAWRLAEPADGFIQAEPHEGQAASEPTEVRILFDRDAIYIGVVCRDARSEERRVGKE